MLLNLQTRCGCSKGYLADVKELSYKNFESKSQLTIYFDFVISDVKELSYKNFESKSQLRVCSINDGVGCERTKL